MVKLGLSSEFASLLSSTVECAQKTVDSNDVCNKGVLRSYIIASWTIVVEHDVGAESSYTRCS